MTGTAGLDRPLRLQPVLVEKVWGGDRLRSLGRAVPDGTTVGESWDVADLDASATPVPDPVSRVVDGEHAGRTLAELIALDRTAVMGDVEPVDGRFPLLVKLLDAGRSLSVQVHPTARLAPESHKTESWVVLDADPGAVLLLGVRDGVTRQDVDAALGTSALVPLLREVPVRRGDVVHVPAGTIHALGAGVLVAEVQTSSDTTHRLWDWADERDGGRELHVEAGAAAIADGWEHNLDAGVLPDGTDVVDVAPYTLTRSSVEDGEAVAASTRGGRPRVLLVLDGTLGWGDGERLGRTRSVLLPAASTVPVHAVGGAASVLVATPC